MGKKKNRAIERSKRKVEYLFGKKSICATERGWREGKGSDSRRKKPLSAQKG